MSFEIETLATQPVRTFFKIKVVRAQGVLRRKTTIDLNYHMTAEKGAYSFLPHFIKRLCNNVFSELPKDDYKTRRHYARNLCKSLVKECPDCVQILHVTKAPETPTKLNYLTSHFAEDVVGNLQALCTALDGDPNKV
jgi:hypothetical protein